MLLPGFGSIAAAQACPGPPLPIEPLRRDAWLVRAAEGDADARNRGFVSNLVVLRDGARLWLVGSGASPAFGERLACRLRRLTGRGVTDVIDPWARPELVLGNAAFAGARLWSHVEVRHAMAVQCPHCMPRLRARLGRHAADLRDHPVRLPTHTFEGERGVLGPWRWWRLRRADAVPVTVLRLQSAPLWIAHGLLWADGPPDLRDAELDAVRASATALLDAAEVDGADARLVPEQGPPLDLPALRRQADYLQALASALDSARARGAIESELPRALPGVDAALLGHPRHGINWQRAWREGEARWFDNLPAR